MIRILILLVVAMLGASPAAAQATEAPRSVRADNPHSQRIVELARALQTQYRDFYRFVTMNPWDADGIMRRYTRYINTYRRYWQAVAGYYQYESNDRSFSGQVLALPRVDESQPFWGGEEPARNPEPVAGADVTLTEFSADGATASTGDGLRATTDRQGRFSIRRLRAGVSYEYHVNKNGYETGRGQFRFGQSSIRRRIVLTPKYRGRIAGQVLGLQRQYAVEMDGVLKDLEGGDVDRLAADVAPEESAAVRILREYPIGIQKEGRYTIRSLGELREVTKGDFMPGDQTFPEIDFKKEMILAASMGVTAGAHSIEIVRVTRSGRRMLVSVRETRPAPGTPVPELAQWPTSAVVVAREEIPVEFRNIGTTPRPVDPRTVPLAGATVEAFRAGPEVAICYGPDMTGPIDPNASIKASIMGPAVHQGRTDRRGRFSIDGLPQGEYILHITRAGYDDLYRRVSASQEDLSLLMIPEGLLVPPPASRDAGTASATETEVTAESTLNNPFGSE